MINSKNIVLLTHIIVDNEVEPVLTGYQGLPPEGEYAPILDMIAMLRDLRKEIEFGLSAGPYSTTMDASLMRIIDKRITELIEEL